MADSTSRATRAFELEPSWPGLRAGALRWMAHPGSTKGEPDFYRWRSAWSASGEDLRAFASAAMTLAPALRDRFPWPGEPLPVMMPGDEINRILQRPGSLAEAQAAIAITWLLGPLLDRSDALGLAAAAREPNEDRARALSTVTLQFPGSPASGEDPGSEGCFRVGFCCQAALDDAVDGSGLEERFALIVATMEPCGLSRDGVVAETAAYPREWSSQRASRAWEVSCLREWADLWKLAAERAHLARAAGQAARSRPSGARL